MKYLFFLLFIALISCTQNDVEPQGEEKAHLNWEIDWDIAVASAQKENKHILVNFTGSDWCYWCVKLEKEVFSKKEFAQYAAENLVLLKLDFPRKEKLPEEQAKKNSLLAEKFKIEGFPTILILNSKGDFLQQTGYQQGGSVKYIEHLKKLMNR